MPDDVKAVLISSRQRLALELAQRATLAAAEMLHAYPDEPTRAQFQRVATAVSRLALMAAEGVPEEALAAVPVAWANSIATKIAAAAIREVLGPPTWAN